MSSLVPLFALCIYTHSLVQTLVSYHLRLFYPVYSKVFWLINKIDTVSSQDTSGAMRQKQTEPITINDAVYTGCGTMNQDKFPIVN